MAFNKFNLVTSLCTLSINIHLRVQVSFKAFFMFQCNVTFTGSFVLMSTIKKHHIMFEYNLILAVSISFFPSFSYIL